MAILDRKALPNTFLHRSVIATDDLGFDSAIRQLSQATVIADMYYIVGGIKAGQGAVITKNRLSVADVWRLDAPERQVNEK